MENDANVFTSNIHGHLGIYFREYISEVDSVKVKFKVSTRFPSKTIYWYREINLSYKPHSHNSPKYKYDQKLNVLNHAL